MNAVSLLVGLAALAAFTGEARAAEPCTATILQNGSALIYGGTVRFEKGRKFERVTQYRIEKTGAVFCSKGGACLPEKTKVGDAEVSALALDNCYVDFRHPYSADGAKIYELKIVRSRFSERELRRIDAHEAFRRRGVEWTRIDQYAQAYADHPDSACGQLTRRVMRGERSAILTMNKDIDRDGNVINPCIQVSLK
ncbi:MULTISPECIES: hypothetical protein [unclassified Sphingomonas]|uniref:hypothetical protein n=1 Tax=unclassified Sphingomonas TaxID=196159 RepID=UPI00083363F4|nr:MULTISPECIES: hypothetical protein [unclassified Sphingomonas]